MFWDIGVEIFVALGERKGMTSLWTPGFWVRRNPCSDVSQQAQPAAMPAFLIFALPLNPRGPFAETKPRNESETALLASSCFQSFLISRNRPRLEKMFVP